MDDFNDTEIKIVPECLCWLGFYSIGDRGIYLHDDFGNLVFLRAAQIQSLTHFYR